MIYFVACGGKFLRFIVLRDVVIFSSYFFLLIGLYLLRVILFRVAVISCLRFFTKYRSHLEGAVCTELSINLSILPAS